MKEIKERSEILKLFEKFDDPKFPAKNRFVRAATWLGLCDEATGRATKGAVARQAETAAGGAGVVISEFAYVSPEGKAAPRQWGLDVSEGTDDVRRLAEAIHGAGSKLIVQLCHGGAAALPAEGRRRLSPSGPSLGESSEDLAAAALDDIKRIKSDFAAAALRAKEGGADGVELHGAHGFLLMEFLSPLFNRRSDEYGGSEEKRMRLLLEILAEVRAAVGPDFPVWVKLSMTEGTEGGYGPETGLAAALALLEGGADGIEISSGAWYSSSEHVPSVVGVSAGDSEAPFAKYSRELKRLAPKGRLVILTGGLRSLPVLAGLLEDEAADLFGISRPFIAEPDLINRWAEDDSRPSACVSCNACFRTGNVGAVNCPIMIDREEGEWDPL